MIQAVGRNHDVPSVVVGVGSELPEQPQAQRFRQKFDVRGPFAIYVGRIDANKGCQELFDYFATYVREGQGRLSLVLVGHPILAVPQHPRIRHVGFLDDADKFDAIAAADLLLMPSYFESLSMVALEAWAMGKPVLANGRCDVLKGQCIRSNGGLYYDNFAEFLETLRAIEFSATLSAALGRNGRAYFNQHYTWPIIEKKYLDMFDRLTREPYTNTLEPMPGWFERRRQLLPSADVVLAEVPTGPALPKSQSSEPLEHREPARNALPALDTGVVAQQAGPTQALPIRQQRPQARFDRRADRRPAPPGPRRRGRDRRPPRRSGN